MLSRFVNATRFVPLVVAAAACTDPVSAPSAGLPAPQTARSVAAVLTGHDFATIDLGILGTPTAFSRSEAHDINSHGVVAGESSTPGTKTQGFIWSATTGMIGLGFVSPTDAGSRGNSINDNGWVAGQSGSRAALWRPGQAPIYLVPGGRTGSAISINNAGTVVGAYDAEVGLRSFKYENDEFRDLGSLSGNQARALGINDLGKIVGGATNSVTFAEHPVIWDPFASWLSLGVLEALGARRGAARAINNAGVVVGFYFPVVGQLSAFVHRPGTGTSPLENADASSTAEAIDNSGRIVGAIGKDAVLWHPTEGTVHLFTLGGANGSAASINDAGVMVGRSENAAGLTRATLWRRNQAPSAQLSGPADGAKRKPLAFTATGSDPDGDTISFTWSFGDGTPVVTGANATHEYDDWGTYTITLTVRDPFGLVSTITRSVVIAPPGKLKHM